MKILQVIKKDGSIINIPDYQTYVYKDTALIIWFWNSFRMFFSYDELQSIEEIEMEK